MKRFKVLLLILIGLSAIPVIAWEKKSDSLLNLIRKSQKEDTARVRWMIEYNTTLFPSDRDSMMRYAGQIVSISKRLRFRNGIVRGLNQIALAKWYGPKPADALPPFRQALAEAMISKDPYLISLVAGNFGLYHRSFGSIDSAIFYSQMAVNEGRKLKDKTRYAKSLSDLSDDYVFMGNYSEAIRNFLELKQYFQSKHSLPDQILSCIRLGIVYSEIGDFERSRNSYNEAEELNRQINDTINTILILSNKGLIYYDLKNDFDSARLYLNRSISLAKRVKGQDMPVLVGSVNLGNVAMEEKNYRLALDHYLAVIDDPRLKSRNYEYAATLINAGIACFFTGQTSKAEKFALEGLDIAIKNQLLKFQRNGYEIMSKIAHARNDFRNAWQYLANADSINKLLWNKDMEKKIAEVTYIQSIQQMENENKLLVKENTIKNNRIFFMWILFAGTVIVLILSVILIMVILNNHRRQGALNAELELKNRQLSELNNTKDRFFSIIAHDLRSPFSAFLNLTELIKTDFDSMSREELFSFNKSMNNSALNLFRLLENLLDWSKIQQGKVHVKSDVLLLQEEVLRSVNLVTPTAGIKNISITTGVPAELKVKADENMLQSILGNLLSNSIKFTSTGGGVSISARAAEDNMTEISVKDTGIGMTEEMIGMLFRIDQNVTRKGTEKEPGSGLGLILCKEFIEMHGGKIWVESAVNQGTVFRFTLPSAGA